MRGLRAYYRRGPRAFYGTPHLSFSVENIEAATASGTDLTSPRCPGRVFNIHWTLAAVRRLIL